MLRRCMPCRQHGVPPVAHLLGVRYRAPSTPSSSREDQCGPAQALLKARDEDLRRLKQLIKQKDTLLAKLEVQRSSRWLECSCAAPGMP